MRLAVFLLLLLLPLAAQAQTVTNPLVQHKPATTAAPATPAAPKAPAIIPGSPLAALAGATTLPPSPEAGASTAPFGTDQLGFVISGAVGGEAVHAFHSFLGAVRDSTRLAPVLVWHTDVSRNPIRRAETYAMLAALLIAVLPAALADALARAALRRPAALCARWALPRQEEFLPSTDTAPELAPKPEATQHRFVSLRAWLRRLGFALLKFLLAISCLIVFIVTGQFLLSCGLITAHPAQLAVTEAANAYLFCRAAQEIMRFLVSPAAPSLRLITMPTARAKALMQWLMIVLATIYFAFTLISGGLILGLPRAGAQVLTRIAALAVHLEAAWGIWQARTVVAIWIMGDRNATGGIAWMRQQLGRRWHYFALFYVLALWVAWAGGVHNAFSLLLRAVVVLIAAVAAGRLAWSASNSLLERAFPDPAAGHGRHPAFLARARAYNPLIRFTIRIVIGIAVLLLILQGWGVNALGWLNSNAISRALVTALVSVFITSAVALAVWELANYGLTNRVELLTASGRARQATRLRTLAPILRAAIGTLIFVVALVVGLSQIGVNTTGLLAVSSVAGIAVGFGSQKLVQDIITGLFMLLEDAIQVGDVVTLAGMSGVVERLSIRTIRLRGGDGSINIIPFSAVTTVTNTTRDFNNAEFAITVSYSENVDHVCAVLADIGREMRKEDNWRAMIRDDVQIFGLDKFGDQGMVIAGQIRTGVGQHWAVRREFFRRVQQRFAADHISMPFGQPNIYQLELPPGLEPPSAPPAAPPPPEAETK